jgi:glycolate oxidase FAD binding subunit
VTGAAFDAQCERVSLRLEGFENSVAYRSDKLSKHLEEYEAEETLDHAASQQHWRMIRDVDALQQTEADVWRISVKPSDAPELINRLKPAIYQLDWGGGLVWVSAKNGEDLRARMGMIKGHATLVRASLETRNQVASFHPELAPIAKLSSGLRQKFDPRGILNPGLMD